jgi:tetratricopeptide (TPR) repeat protein
MKKYFVTAALAAALLGTAAQAQMGGGAPASSSSSTPAHKSGGDHLSKDVATTLKAAQDALQAKDNNTALAQVKAAQALPDRSAYDDFTINRFLSAVSASMQDYKTSADAFDSFIASPFFAGLTPEEQKAAYHDATVVSQNAQHWQKTIEYGQKLEAINGLDDLTMTMMAIGYYQLKDEANAQKYAQMAIDAAKAAGKTPEPNAQIILGNIQGKTNPDAARKSVEAIVLNTNNPEDWGRLIDDALSHKANSIDALYLYRLRNQVGAMQKGDDYTIWGELATQQKLDKEALGAYDKGIAAGKLTAGQLGKGYSTARSAAAQDAGVLSVAASAASKSKRGEDALRVGEDYWGYGRYADAETMARDALAKGVKDTGEANMLLGASLVAQGKTAEAETTFAKVSGNDVRSRAAHLWSLYAQVKAKGTPAAK